LGLTKNPQKLVTDIFDAFFPSLSSSSLIFIFLHSTKFLYCSYFPWAQALQKNHRWLLFPVTGNVLITGEKRWRKKRDSWASLDTAESLERSSNHRSLLVGGGSGGAYSRTHAECLSQDVIN
jgi:hypothetical protein